MLREGLDRHRRHVPQVGHELVHKKTGPGFPGPVSFVPCPLVSTEDRRLKTDLYQSTVALKRTNRGFMIDVGRIHAAPRLLAPAVPKTWLNAVP